MLWLQNDAQWSSNDRQVIQVALVANDGTEEVQWLPTHCPKIARGRLCIAQPTLVAIGCRAGMQAGGSVDAQIVRRTP